MKTFLQIFQESVFHLIMLVLICMGCTKVRPIEKKDKIGSQAQTIFSNQDCRLLGTAVMVHTWDNRQYWVNTLLKWFDGNGRLTHLKAYIPWEWQTYTRMQFQLEYGEVSHDDNMIYLKNILYDRMIMKVKLDENRRPKTSWFLDSLNSFANFKFLVGDTSEYFYLPDGRLDSIGSRFSGLHYSWHFVYDGLGNVTRLENSTGRVNFKYDYTKPTNGMATDYLFSVPLKLMEYMELIRFPHHHELIRVIYGSHWPGAPYEDETYPVFQWTFYNIQPNSNGAVLSYQEAISYPYQNIYYNAWDCSGGQNFLSLNPSREEFMRTVNK